MCERVGLEEVGQTAGGGISDMEGVKGVYKGVEEPPGCEGVGGARVCACGVLQRDDT